MCSHHCHRRTPPASSPPAASGNCSSRSHGTRQAGLSLHQPLLLSPEERLVSLLRLLDAADCRGGCLIVLGDRGLQGAHIGGELLDVAMKRIGIAEANGDGHPAGLDGGFGDALEDVEELVGLFSHVDLRGDQRQPLRELRRWGVLPGWVMPAACRRRAARLGGRDDSDSGATFSISRFMSSERLNGSGGRLFLRHSP